MNKQTHLKKKHWGYFQWIDSLNDNCYHDSVWTSNCSFPNLISFPVKSLKKFSNITKLA